ncbi:MAG: DUF1810 family protein [Pseudaminobacter sp.]
MSDEYDLQRFVSAQDAVYDGAIAALRQGAMPISCMEFIFPRLHAGTSVITPRRYAIHSIDEASAYLQFPTLGGRYRECIGILQRLPTRDACSVFGESGAMQLHASLTLFSEASRDEFLMETMFDVWFDGLLHEDTMVRIKLMS